MALFIVQMNLSKRRPPGKFLRSTTIITPEEWAEKRKRDGKGKDGFIFYREAVHIQVFTMMTNFNLRVGSSNLEQYENKNKRSTLSELIETIPFHYFSSP